MANVVKMKDPEDEITAKELPPQVIEAFASLAHAQRGEPEDIMVKAQLVMGGGVLNYAIEHTGDLTHRMADRHHVSLPYMHAGFTYVEEKVRQVLRMLRNPYGFAREHRENMLNNARYDAGSLEVYQEKVKKALERYVKAHRKLRVFNAMQYFAREAAIALGEENFWRAEELLSRLEANLDTPEKWARRATEYELTPAGLVKTFPYPSR